MMQHGYLLQALSGELTRCTASLLHISPRASILTGIEVEFRLRDRGYGTELLKLVLADADKEGVTLLLSVSSDDSPKALTNDQLQAWYARHGFYVIEGKTGTGTNMQRLPQEQA
jgi:N-acetylglutamate synthase-like GNAT family acetyltransferase